MLGALVKIPYLVTILILIPAPTPVGRDCGVH